MVDRVVAMMFGREGAGEGLEEALLGDASEHRGTSAVDRSGIPLVSLVDAETEAMRGECPLNSANLELWPGEVLGIAGVDGNGQKHLAEVLAGQRSLRAGAMTLAGEEVTAMTVAQRRDRGVRYITDERLGEGTAAAHSVATNLVVKEIGRPPFWRHGLTFWGAINQNARDKIGKHDVRAASEKVAIATLSGGNIQKVLLAREMASDARLVIFNKPTYGLDLQNTKRARDWIRAGAGATNAAVLVISNELDELLEVCHRIAVIERGKIVGSVENRSGAEAEIGRMMTGAKAA